LLPTEAFRQVPDTASHKGASLFVSFCERLDIDRRLA
jgi:hypothetical protein